MITKPLDQITKEDIEALVENAVAEARQIEYKRGLPGAGSEDRKEFLADVTSFANASGGHLLYGVVEEAGAAHSAPGLAGVNVDEAKQRLENMLRDGIEPRIPGVRMRAIEGFSEGPVLILHIPQSWASPHMVAVRASRFYSRNSAGKYSLDVQQIRSAFLGREGLSQGIRQFRDARLARIVAGETPIPLRRGAKAVLHLIPLVSFARNFQLGAHEIMEHCVGLCPLGYSASGRRFNLDGVLAYSGTEESSGGGPRGYCQVFRSAVIESVKTDIVGEIGGRPFLRGDCAEHVISAVRDYLRLLQCLAVPCPFLIILSFLGVKSAQMHVGEHMRMMREPTPIDRDMLTLPEIMIENYECDVPHELRPIFDAVWNACGYERSLNYDKEGNWNPRR